ncbi:MAG: M1 family metallopeptidase [Bacteroidota bacterium]
MKTLFRTLFAFLAFSLLAGQAYCQMFIPGEFRDALEEGTRSIDGKPGEAYFQNYADYVLDVDFNPRTGHLDGNAEITYYNLSPDTLNRLVVRNHMNLFKKGVPRDFNVGEADLHDGVEISDVQIDGEKIPDNYDNIRHNGTIMTISLPEPLAPGEKTALSLNWAFPLPKEVSIRYGRYGEDNWMVAYWYPQIAVYDDISGWDTHPFTGSAEFYNDFNNFDVSITVPEDYLVWATGLLQDEEKHFTGEILDRLRLSRESDDVVHVLKEEDINEGGFLKDRQKWRYVAESAPDFAFAVSRSYIWDATSVEVEPGRRVWVDAVYKTNSKDFHKVARLSAEIIDLFSADVIGEPYPYPKMTAFNGSGGMEFPMIINDGDASSHEGTVHLTAHEIGHTYFPFHVMTNESFYAFMDEGLVSFIPRIVNGIMLDDNSPMRGIVQSYAAQASTFRQVPLMVPSDMISDYSAYRVHAYTRPANAFFVLQQMLGEERFKEVIFEYIQRWKKKHPTPYDFFNTVEDFTGKDLSWFWNPWFFEKGYPDLAIRKVKKGKKSYEVLIEKRGNLPVPLQLKIRYEDGTEETIERSAEIWKESDVFNYQIPENKTISFIYLGGMNIPDSYPGNNLFTKDSEE